ncbi:MAG TPA: LytTR family DNA-binding domain-containing protein [Polyangiaceae bacterium]|jgi:two-component system LytT family response regulator|nr:LytTR family DNA-binding domain-containing protein [Polyangiaceae bacterium]
MVLRTVLVEDEQASRDLMKRLLTKHKDTVVVVAEADNGPAAVETIREHEPDLVLLDVSLPGLDGFEVLAALTTKPAIVFTTGYDAYAVRAFRASATDYLLKPVDAEQLAAAIAKVLAQHSARAPHNFTELLSALRTGRERELKRVACRVGDSTVFVALEDVQYFRADHGYTMVKSGTQELLIDTPLADLESRLNPTDFLRVHRNTLVNMNQVSSLRRLPDGRMKIVLKDGSELSSSRRFADSLRNWS